MTGNPANGNGPDMEYTLEAQLFQVGARIGKSREVVRKAIEGRPTREARKELLRKWKRQEAADGRWLNRVLDKREAEERARQAEENYRAFRVVADAERDGIRRSQSPGQRLDAALRELRSLSNVSAALVERASHSSETAIPVPTEDLAGEYERRVLLLVGAIEKRVDAIRLRPMQGIETPEEKNQRLLRDYEGMDAWTVCFVDPSAGHYKSLERIRRLNGRRAVDGRLQERKAA